MSVPLAAAISMAELSTAWALTLCLLLPVTEFAHWLRAQRTHRKVLAACMRWGATLRSTATTESWKTPKNNPHPYLASVSKLLKGTVLCSQGQNGGYTRMSQILNKGGQDQVKMAEIKFEVNHPRTLPLPHRGSNFTLRHQLQQEPHHKQEASLHSSHWVQTLTI